MSNPLETAANVAGGPARLRYSHDAMIDQIIANPAVSQNALASVFGYSVGWVSRIINTDAFQARLAERKDELVDPGILLNLEERLSTLANRSLEILHEKLELTKNPDLALKAADMSLKAMGYGARVAQSNVQNNYVVALPAQVPGEKDWAARHAASGHLPPKDGTVTDLELLSPDLAALVPALPVVQRV